MLITRKALDERVRGEVANLGAEDLLWWSEHCVEPFVVTRDGYAHYAVARTGGSPLIFFDRHDSFGQYAEEPWENGLRLYKDLAEAVRCLATRDSMSRLLSETASSLLKMGFLDRGDDGAGILSRALEVLAAFGPDAGVAVLKLIEITSNDDLLGGLQEKAVATLSAIGPGAAQAVPRLIAMAENDTANARGWCLQAFGSIGPAATAAIPLIIDIMLRRVAIDPDPFYVPMAADALGNIGAIEALPALLQVLRETDDPDVAVAAVRAIGKFGPDAAEARPILTILAGGDLEANRFPKHAEIGEAAREALQRVGKSKPVDPPEPA